MRIKEINILPGFILPGFRKSWEIRRLVKNVEEGDSFCDALFSWKRFENKFDNCTDIIVGFFCLFFFIKFYFVTKENRIKL